MKLNISGQHMETGDSLKNHCESKMLELKKYFEHVIDVDVTYIAPTHHRNHHLAEVHVHANGIHLHAEGDGADFYIATDAAAAKLVKQLQKYKGRLNKHRARRQEFAAQFGNIQPMEVTSHDIDETGLEDAAADLFADMAPEVSKKVVSKVAPMSIDEAVMQMDLLHKPAFLFQNAKTGNLNLVYREGDNRVKWIEPAA